jgi:hypothetical protein
MRKKGGGGGGGGGRGRTFRACLQHLTPCNFRIIAAAAWD